VRTGHSLLIAGAFACFGLAAVHLALVFRPPGWTYFGAGAFSAYAQQQARWLKPVTAGLALLFGVWGIYALAGAGLAGPLPLQQAVLVSAGVILLIRGLALFADVARGVAGTQPWRMAAFSAVALATGVLILVGAAG
jgi:hypothetical protein